MNVFWIILIAQSAFLAVSLHTGKVNLIGWPSISRLDEPGYFRLCIVALLASIVVIAWQAISETF